jgi:hypothetical protein
MLSTASNRAGGFRQRLDTAVTVVDREARLLGVQGGDLDVLLGGIEAGHLGAETRQGFRQQAAAATDVEQLQPLQRLVVLGIAVEARAEAVADEAEAQRVEAVQRSELAVGVPPGFRHGGELGDLLRIHAGGIDAGGSLRCCLARFASFGLDHDVPPRCFGPRIRAPDPCTAARLRVWIAAAFRATTQVACGPGGAARRPVPRQERNRNKAEDVDGPYRDEIRGHFGCRPGAHTPRRHED